MARLRASLLTTRDEAVSRHRNEGKIRNPDLFTGFRFS